MGDDGFDALYRDRHLAMVRLAVLLVDRRTIADEVVHDAFAAVYARWGTLDAPAAYLRRAVVNGCNDVLRKRRNRREVELGDAADGVPVGSSGDELRDVIAGLPPRQRTVVVLRFYEDLPIEEIAIVMGIPAGTVKSSLHRALARLREEVER
jgi:RNA polymerase sigma-70 factor (sigma-E family)